MVNGGGGVYAILTEEQEMLRALAGSIAQRFGLAMPRDLESVDPEAAWAVLDDAGLLALRERDDDGRPASSGIEVMIVTRELAGKLVPVPFGPSGVLANELLALSALRGGEAFPSDPRCRYGLALRADLQDLADATGAGPAVCWGAEGAAYVLALREAQGETALIRVAVPAAPSPEPGQSDLTSPLRRIDSLGEHGVDVIGVLDEESLVRWTALALVVTSADLVGAVRSALSGVVEYSKVRIAYDVPIGSFQAVQHLCAEAYKQVEGASSAVDYAAWAADELSPDSALLAARTAKAYAASIGMEVAETVMQVYGGVGQIWDHIAHFYTRRVLLDTALFGAESFQLDRIASARLGGT
jgi:alkylation response protein AidB-like acyl-CoA dehydrogenase